MVGVFIEDMMKKSKQVILWLFVASGVGMAVAMLFFPGVFVQHGILLAFQIGVGVPSAKHMGAPNSNNRAVLQSHSPGLFTQLSQRFKCC
jgi:hypothetical protein